VPHDRIVSIQTTSERGGAEYANVDLLEALRQRGHEVLLVTNVPDIAAKTGVPVLPIDLGPKLSKRSVGQLLLRSPQNLLKLIGVLRRTRPGISFLHFKKEQLLFALLPKRLTGEVVWAEWGPVPPNLRSGLPRRLYAFAGRRARGVMAVSEGTRKTVVDAGVPAARVIVVPNLVDVDEVHFDAAARERLRAEWGAGEQTLVVGLISRFQRRKRNDVVIDAMEHLDGDVLLVVAGEGEEESALRERAARYGDRVRFAPNVRGHVEAFLSACDVLAFAPSPTEGAPRVIVMAQLVGVPVVASDPEGAAGLIPPGGGVICSPSHDPRAVAAALAVYRDDPERRRREGEVGRQACRELHAMERTLSTVERLFGLRP